MLIPPKFASVSYSDLSNGSKCWIISKSKKGNPIALGPFEVRKFRADGTIAVGFPPEFVYVGYPAGYESAGHLEYDHEWVAGLMIAGQFREVPQSQLCVPKPEEKKRSKKSRSLQSRHSDIPVKAGGSKLTPKEWREKLGHLPPQKRYAPVYPIDRELEFALNK